MFPRLLKDDFVEVNSDIKIDPSAKVILRFNSGNRIGEGSSNKLYCSSHIAFKNVTYNGILKLVDETLREKLMSRSKDRFGTLEDVKSRNNRTQDGISSRCYPRLSHEQVSLQKVSCGTKSLNILVSTKKLLQEEGKKFGIEIEVVFN